MRQHAWRIYAHVINTPYPQASRQATIAHQPSNRTLIVVPTELLTASTYLILWLHFCPYNPSLLRRRNKKPKNPGQTTRLQPLKGRFFSIRTSMATAL